MPFSIKEEVLLQRIEQYVKRENKVLFQLKKKETEPKIAEHKKEATKQSYSVKYAREQTPLRMQVFASNTKYTGKFYKLDTFPKLWPQGKCFLSSENFIA